MSDNEYRQILASFSTQTILSALLDAPYTFVSGSLLAEQLGVSRPAIHGKLAKLREQGFEIEAIRNKGYRLVKEPEVLHADLISYYMEKSGTPIEVLYFPVIDSTNSEAERQLSRRHDTPSLLLLVAKRKEEAASGATGTVRALRIFISLSSLSRIFHRKRSSTLPCGPVFTFAVPFKVLSQKRL